MMSSTIEGYVVTVGVYVQKSYYIGGDDNEETAVEIAIEDFKEDLGDLEHEELDIEVLDTSPEYHEDE
jgi:hypothetical protein